MAPPIDYRVSRDVNYKWHVQAGMHGEIVFSNYDQSVVVAEAQRLNGFDVVDGNWNTYCHQKGFRQ